MIGFTEPKVIGSVNSKIGGVNVVAFESGFQEFRVVDCAMLLEVQLLVLCY
jgi:hypothetical protein